MGLTSIEWTDFTFNPWWGCEKVSAGCKNCYAESLDNRYHHDNPHWGPGSSRKKMSPKHWMQPFAWNGTAKLAGKQARVFCASMADIFEDHPDVTEWRQRLFEIIENTPALIWQLLTKRPENIMKLAPRHWQTDSFPPNVWMGTSIENQEQAAIRIPWLLKCRAQTLFLSCEPLLGPLNLEQIDCNPYHEDFCMVNALSGIQTDMGRPWWDVRSIDWVIVGGESGHKARPMMNAWAVNIKRQCLANGTAFFMKQIIGADKKKMRFSEFPEGLQLRQFPHFVRKNFNLQCPTYLTGNNANS